MKSAAANIPAHLPIALTVLSAAVLAFFACDKIMESKALTSISKAAKVEPSPISTVKKGHLEGGLDFTVGGTFGDSENVFKDPRDGKAYAMLSIGGHVWMAKNLSFATAKSKCYNNDDSYCVRYGRLYDWDEAMAACPAGWRLPNNEEWSDLVFAAGGRGAAGKKLKAKEGWSHSGNGIDAFGFSALPGGTFGASASGDSAAFAAGGISGRWWSATEHNGGGAFYVAMHNSDNIVTVGNERSYVFSVRCIREETVPQQVNPQVAAQPSPQPVQQKPVASSTPIRTRKPAPAPMTTQMPMMPIPILPPVSPTPQDP